MEYYSVTKRNEILIHVTIGMYLENMLNERTWSQKVTYYKTALGGNVKKRKIYRGKCSMVTRSWEEMYMENDY